jgi:hypothetical protein
MRKILGLAAVVIASLALSACDTKSAASVTHSVQGLETASGTFYGASDHATSGTASIFRVDGQWVVSFGSDFSFDGAPDPHVALGHDGYRADATLGKLSSNNGAQVYAIPGGLDLVRKVLGAARHREAEAALTPLTGGQRQGRSPGWRGLDPGRAS